MQMFSERSLECSSETASSSEIETVRICDLCGNDLLEAQEIYKVREFGIIQCRSCGLVVTSPRPKPEYISKYYHDTFFNFQAEGEDRRGKLIELIRTRKFSVLRRFVRYALSEWVKDSTYTLLSSNGQSELNLHERLLLKIYDFICEPVIRIPFLRDGKLLDIGFGRGEFLVRARRLGWDAYGVDISEHGVSEARSRGIKAHLVHPDFEDLPYEREQFDAILLQSVLEHVFQPARVLQICFDMLKPGGLLLAIVPSWNCPERKMFGSAWSLLDLPQHLYHFEFTTLRDMLNKVGFDVEKVLYKKYTTTISDRSSLRMYRRQMEHVGIAGKANLINFYFKLMLWKRIERFMAHRRGNGQGIAVYCRRPTS